MKATISKVLSLLVFLSVFVSACGSPAGAIAVPQPVPLPQIDPQLAASVPYAAPIVLAALVSGAASYEETVNCISAEGEPNLVINPDPRAGLPMQPGCIHVTRDGDANKIRSRVTAAKEVMDKTPDRCQKRGADTALIFAANYRGTKHEYHSVAFIMNAADPTMSTFIPAGNDVSTSRLKGFDYGDSPLDDSQCQKAWSFMRSLIDEMRALPGWTE